MSQLIFQRLLALVNSALWGKEIDHNLFTEMDDEMWNDLYKFSIRHGVMAIAFDGVSNLPNNLKPSLKLRMSWTLSCEQIEKKYLHMRQTVVDLTSLLKKKKINTLVFKGLNLSSCYPIPTHREFGDIDIYLFGQYIKGESTMLETGSTKIEIPNYKHSNHIYKGVLIENHRYLLDIHDSPKILKLNQTLLDILDIEETEQSPLKNGILYPSANFSALFLITHAIKHLSTDPLALRTYCDWALFLQAHHQDIDIPKWKNALNEAGLFHIAKVFTELAFTWLDVSPSCSPIPLDNNNSDRERWISEEMWQSLYPECKSKKKWDIFKYKYKRYHKTYKRHAHLYNKSFYKDYPNYIFTTFKNHIRLPKTFFTLK